MLNNMTFFGYIAMGNNKFPKNYNSFIFKQQKKGSVYFFLNILYKYGQD